VVACGSGGRYSFDGTCKEDGGGKFDDNDIGILLLVFFQWSLRGEAMEEGLLTVAQAFGGC